MNVNYLAEINAFERWLETNYLPISSQLLWYKLMAFCNRSGWCGWVTVDNLRLMAAMQMSREASLIKVRDDLIKAGLVEYQKGKKGSPNRYRMNYFTFKSEVQSVVESGVQSAVESVVESGVQSVDIYKLKENKTPLSDRACRFLEFWDAYPKQVNQQMAQQSYISLLACTPTLPEGVLVQAAGNYAEACQLRGTQGRYVKNPENWLADGVWMDYTPEKYRRPELPQERGRRSDGSMGRNDKPAAKGVNERLLESGYKPEYKEYPFAD